MGSSPPHQKSSCSYRDKTNLPGQSSGLHSALLNPNKRVHHCGLPSGSVVKNSPANDGDVGSIPDPGRSHMPRGCGLPLLGPCSATREASTIRNTYVATRSRAHSPQPDTACVQQEDPAQPEINKQSVFKKKSIPSAACLLLLYRKTRLGLHESSMESHRLSVLRLEGSWKSSRSVFLI